MASRETVPRKSEVYEPYRPASVSERALIGWLDSYGVSVVRATPQAPAGLDSSEADFSLRRVVIESTDSVLALFHEAMHIYLSASGFSPEYLFRIPDDLGGRGSAYEYRRLSGLVSSVIEAEEELSGPGILALRKAVGIPEGYEVYRESGGAFSGMFQFTMSGNLVDETVTLGKSRSHGHPMQDFHEYFASAMTTMAYDGEVFFRNLSRLERASRTEPGLRELYGRTAELLRAVHQYARTLPDELRVAGFPNAARLERNLERLGEHLQQRRETEQAR